MGMLEYMIGGAAVLISAVSLSLAISANKTQERLLAASTWPLLQFATGNRAEDGTAAISLVLQNAGVGPARVKTVVVEYEGVIQSNARKLLDACCGSEGKPVVTLTGGPERVLTANESVTFLRIDEAGLDAEIWNKFNRERFKVRVLSCYCSVLGDCWQADSEQADPQPVKQCPQIPDADRWHG
jgi:hypothetical protein